PDFAQVEADQLVVTANQRFPIFFEEKRPFFLEGVEIFQTPVRVVHTRTIVDPDWALKLAGKRGRNSFGLLVASDKAPGNFSDVEREDPAIRPQIERFLDRNARVGVLRLKRDVGSQSSVGLIATSYDFVERHNRLFGVDGRFTLGQQTVLGFQLLGTTSRRFFYDPDLDGSTYRTGNGFGYSAQLQRTGRRVVLTLVGEGRTPDYRADVGFTTQTNVNDWSLVARYNSEPRTDSKLISWSVLNTTRAQFDWQGRMKYAYVYPRVLMNFKRQTYLNLYAYKDYLRLLEEEFGARRSAARPGAFAGDAGRRTIYHGFTFEAGTTPSKKYSASIVVDRAWKNYDYDFGAGPRFPRVSPAALAGDPTAPLDPGTGDTLDINASLAWQPTDALRLSLNHVRSRLVRDDTGRVAYDQKLYSLKTTYQFTRFTFARARADYDTLRSNVSGQFLFGWTPNPGTALYAGYNDDLSLNGFSPFTGRPEGGLRRNGRTFFVKMSYLWRRGL
ncbi:MAG: TonB-dependent receptor, partial [Rubrivivax sp.]|nr:TonB-dependent receptor [Pyrinomonadaceae bacterium]